MEPGDEVVGMEALQEGSSPLQKTGMEKGLAPKNTGGSHGAEKAY